jgi:hypothetical protein
VEQAAQSGEVHAEPEPVHDDPADESAPEDPGADSGPTGLPEAQELAMEALLPETPLVRLRAIYRMVNPRSNEHPELATVPVFNENGEQEMLAQLVWRQLDAAKKTEGAK